MSATYLWVFTSLTPDPVRPSVGLPVGHVVAREVGVHPCGDRDRGG